MLKGIIGDEPGRGKYVILPLSLQGENLVSNDFETLEHPKFMREALREAELALQQEERPIGAVIVHRGKIIGRGRAQHQKRHSEVAHAELNAMIQAERYLRDHNHECVLYTTLEPCVMCLGASVMSDIQAVVFAMPDNWIKAGRMLEMDYVRRHIKHYVGGVLETECASLWLKYDPNELRMIQNGQK
jgi:tRNA(adenine34) deaminase